MKYQDRGDPLIYIKIEDEWIYLTAEEAKENGLNWSFGQMFLERDTGYDYIFYYRCGWNAFIKLKSDGGEYIYKLLTAEDLPPQVRLLFLLTEGCSL